jgi:hypothetical protein
MTKYFKLVSSLFLNKNIIKMKAEELRFNGSKWELRKKINELESQLKAEQEATHNAHQLYLDTNLMLHEAREKLKEERKELLTEFVKFADKVYWAENEYTEYKDIIPLFLTSNPK